jgi:hypothetical protein
MARPSTRVSEHRKTDLDGLGSAVAELYTRTEHGIDLDRTEFIASVRI